jgi:chromosome segregation ATPase
MSRTLFEDDLSYADVQKASAYDVGTAVSYEAIKLRSSFQSKFLKEQNEIHRLRLELDRAENDHYETVRECKRQLRELEEQARTRQAAQAQAKEIAMRETARRVQAMEKEINRQSQEHEMNLVRLTERKSQVHADISAVKQKMEESKRLHQTRVAKLRDALDEFRGDVRSGMQRRRNLDAESNTLARTVQALELELAAATADYESAQAVLQTVRTDLQRMKADYNDLRGAAHP